MTQETDMYLDNVDYIEEGNPLWGNLIAAAMLGLAAGLFLNWMIGLAVGIVLFVALRVHNGIRQRRQAAAYRYYQEMTVDTGTGYAGEIIPTAPETHNLPDTPSGDNRDGLDGAGAGNVDIATADPVQHSGDIPADLIPRPPETPRPTHGDYEGNGFETTGAEEPYMLFGDIPVYVAEGPEMVPEVAPVPVQQPPQPTSLSWWADPDGGLRYVMLAAGLAAIASFALNTLRSLALPLLALAGVIGGVWFFLKRRKQQAYGIPFGLGTLLGLRFKIFLVAVVGIVVVGVGTALFMGNVEVPKLGILTAIQDTVAGLVQDPNTGGAPAAPTEALPTPMPENDTYTALQPELLQLKAELAAARESDGLEALNAAGRIVDAQANNLRDNLELLLASGDDYIIFSEINEGDNQAGIVGLVQSYNELEAWLPGYLTTADQLVVEEYLTADTAARFKSHAEGYVECSGYLTAMSQALETPKGMTADDISASFEKFGGAWTHDMPAWSIAEQNLAAYNVCAEKLATTGPTGTTALTTLPADFVTILRDAFPPKEYVPPTPTPGAQALTPQERLDEVAAAAAPITPTATTTPTPLPTFTPAPTPTPDLGPFGNGCPEETPFLYIDTCYSWPDARPFVFEWLGRLKTPEDWYCAEDVNGPAVTQILLKAAAMVYTLDLVQDPVERYITVINSPLTTRAQTNSALIYLGCVAAEDAPEPTAVVPEEDGVAGGGNAPEVVLDVTVEEALANLPNTQVEYFWANGGFYGDSRDQARGTYTAAWDSLLNGLEGKTCDPYTPDEVTMLILEVCSRDYQIKYTTPDTDPYYEDRQCDLIPAWWKIVDAFKEAERPGW
jgi:hypothetical protein